VSAPPTLDSALEALLVKHSKSSKELAGAIRDAIKADQRFKNLNPVLVAEEIATFMESFSGGLINIESAVEGINKTVRLNPNALLKPESWLTKVSQNLHSLPTEQKINASMWGVGALLGVFGFARSVGHSVKKDEKGENHVQWSNVGITLLNAVTVALCTSMAIQAARAGAAR